ncbi:ZIP family metal transporter [Parvularcula sp. LCG005]|uniref:ZIP family metal transporter n=1 Tax=Parvularcula sp. LCG005 TaxID=3078805 RepID=UPI003978068E
MLTLIIVSVIVSAALIVGAVWGVYGKLPKQVEGFIIALAGGALIASVMSELVTPSIEEAGLLWAVLGVGIGAAVFTGVDYLIDEKWNSSSGGGLLAAISLDGIPENLALGVALIGAGPKEVAALAGSILLSNLPEAAGGAKQMRDGDMSKKKILLLWSATAGILSVAAIGGNLLLEGAPDEALGVIRCIAAGAVVASLATEVFPQAFREDHHMTGIAVSLGLILSVLLSSLSG